MKGFTVAWRFENFSYYWHKEDSPEINSHEFQVKAIHGAKWKLKLFGSTHGFRMEDSIGLCLQRAEVDDGSACLVLDVELSFLAIGKPHAYVTERFLNNFRKGDTSDAVYVMKDEALSLMRSAFLPEDVLTVRCRVWELDSFLIEEEQCLIRTIIGVERDFFVGTLENVSCLVPELKTCVHTNSLSKDQLSLAMKVFLTDEGRFVVEIPIHYEFIKLYMCKILILDSVGCWQACGQSVEWKKSGEVCKFPLAVSFETLLNDKRQYLPKGAMTLQCEVVFSTFVEPERTELVDYGFEVCQSVQWTKSNNHGVHSVHNTSLESGALKDDLYVLYKEGTLCDAKLCTETETFRTHKTVLSARSPVFKTMFTSDMKERTDECVHIPDLGDYTVRRMLHFLYTDRVDNLQWESAKDLYFAADKYGIISLKLKCSSLLKQCLQTSNCCDLLILADMHNDADLKKFVLNYIIMQGANFFVSSEWEVFMKNHVHLAAESYSMYFKFAKGT